MLEFCNFHLVCPPPSRLVSRRAVCRVTLHRQVGLLVEHRSLYATYGKVHGRFLDNQSDK